MTLNERIYQEEPIIGGRKVRAYSNIVKLKLARILRWREIEDSDRNEELLFAFLYLVAAPIEEVSINTLNKNQYLVSKDKFLESLTPEDLKTGADWFVEVTNLERETTIEVAPKPGTPSKDTPPPN